MRPIINLFLPMELFCIGGNNAEIYRNRKGYFSLNVQAVADANNFIRDIVVRWPGSAHDTNIFENSLLRMRFENGEFNNGLLLGDSGYPIRSYLITPLLNPVTQGENLLMKLKYALGTLLNVPLEYGKEDFLYFLQAYDVA